MRPLKEAVSKRDRDRVLQALPRGMHETYERLLRDVGETNTQHVRRIMTLLVIQTAPWLWKKSAMQVRLIFKSRRVSTLKVNFSPNMSFDKSV
jgi:hypothetical protein